MQPNAHKDLREIWLSPNRGAAEAAMTIFAEKYAPKYDKAVECLIKDRQTLPTFFTTFPPITGTTCELRTRSRACSRR